MKTVIDQIEIRPQEGHVQVRLVKQRMKDGRMEIEYHRTTLTPGEDPHERMRVVNAHLALMGFAPVTDYQCVVDHCCAAHTAEVIAAFKAKEKKE